MKKKMYIYPETHVDCVNTRLMALTDAASVLPGPGSQAPGRKTEVF